MLRILVDFNAMTIDGRAVYINEDIQPNLREFYEGQRVMLYATADLEVEAVLEKTRTEDGREIWLAVPDWSTQRDL